MLDAVLFHRRVQDLDRFAVLLGLVKGQPFVGGVLGHRHPLGVLDHRQGGVNFLDVLGTVRGLGRGGERCAGERGDSGYQ